MRAHPYGVQCPAELWSGCHLNRRVQVVSRERGPDVWGSETTGQTCRGGGWSSNEALKVRQGSIPSVAGPSPAPLP